MKINKINGEKVAFFTKKLPLKTQITNTTNDNLNELPNLPKYYQAINSVYFSGNAKFLACPVKDKNNKITSIKIYIPTQNKDSSTFEFDEPDSIKLLSTKTGVIDNQTVSLFVELFNDYYKIAKQELEEEKIFLNQILKDDSQTFLLNASQNTLEAFEKTVEAGNKNYLKTLFSNIKDTRYRHELASVYLELIDEKIAQIAMTCAKEALMVLKLSKKDDIIDMSNMDIKRDIAVYCVNYSKLVQYNCSSLIIKNSSDKDGNIDLNFALKLAKTLQNSKSKENPEIYIPKTAESLKQNPFC